MRFSSRFLLEREKDRVLRALKHTGIFYRTAHISNFPSDLKREKLLAFRWVLYPFKRVIFQISGDFLPL